MNEKYHSENSKNNALLMIMHYFFPHNIDIALFHYIFWGIMIMHYHYYFSVMPIPWSGPIEGWYQCDEMQYISIWPLYNVLSGKWTHIDFWQRLERREKFCWWLRTLVTSVLDYLFLPSSLALTLNYYYYFCPYCSDYSSK